MTKEFEDFADRVTDELIDCLQENGYGHITVGVRSVETAGGSYEAVNVKLNGTEMAVSANLSKAYETYLSGMPMEEIAENLTHQVSHTLAQIFDFFLHARIVLEEVLIRNMKIRYLWFRHVHLNIALAGKIDLIVTKSVSRFARNTVDSLTTIRKLKENGIECYFEKENIWTFDGKGELLITIMSSLAQEESRSISENCTWGHRKRFADGKVSVAYSRFLGYDRGPNGGLVINQDEVKTIRKIYRLFLEGMTPCCRKPTPSITSRRKQRSTKARFRSTMSRVTMRPSLIRMFSTRCRLSLRNAVRAGTATAVATTSPAKSNAASAAAGTAPRSGTARTNTGKSSGNAITNTTARSAPRHT